jgi:hypothetical protein
MRGFQLGARLARENLLAFQANNAGHAHAQDPEALTNYHIEQQVLQNQVAMWDRAYIDARQRASDVDDRDSSEDPEDPEDSKDAESEQENEDENPDDEDENPEFYGVINELSDHAESSPINSDEFEICSSETDVERPAKRTKLFTAGPSLPAQARMARLRGRRYQTRHNEHLIQGQEALDAATVIRRRNLNREIVEAEKERQRQAWKQKMQVAAWRRRKAATIVTAPSQPPVAEQVESQQQSQPDENESDDDRKLTPEELEAQNKKEHKD